MKNLGEMFQIFENFFNKKTKFEEFCEIFEQILQNIFKCSKEKFDNVSVKFFV